MELYVNSGNTIVSEENRYHSGTILPDEIVNMWSKDDIERLINQGVISKKEPQLDPVVDAKTGSATIKKGSKSPKSEKFSSKQLSKEIEEKEKNLLKDKNDKNKK